MAASRGTGSTGMPELKAGFFWLAGSAGAHSPPGRWPNGMAGWLPALALIAASLRFEVTRSFQSFISRLPPSLGSCP